MTLALGAPPRPLVTYKYIVRYIRMGFLNPWLYAHQDALNAQHRGSSHQGLGMLSLGTDDAAVPGRRDDMDTFAERGLEREPALLEVGR